MNLKYILTIAGLMLSLSSMSQPPFLIDKVISKNQITTFTNQKLLVIDFWATWCGPCVPATKQLEIIQETKPNDVFIVSVSDEKEDVISTFLQKKPIRLTVIRDYPPNSMISLFNVERRPYSVLLTTTGEVLYSGHPSGITIELIEKHASRLKSKGKKEWDDLFTSMADRVANNTTNYKAKNVGFNISRKPGVSKSIYSENGIFNFTGRISELIEYMTDCSSWQVSLQNMNDYEVAMTCSENEMATDKNKILERISGALRLDIRSQSKTIEGTIVEVADAKRLWNDEQISWGAENSQGYIIGSDRIDADNITIRQVANLLSDVKKTFFYYGGQDTQLHDWSFHYLYDNLMEEDLLYNFGIKLKKGKIRVPSYMVSPM